jgi:CRISPR-associated protein Csx17
MINLIRLPGCRPEPLLAYLKALGVFRLVAEQADPAARAAWEGDVFVLHSALSGAEVLAFFAERYIPTPIVAPWAGGSGFFEGDNTNALEAITKSKSPRLEPYRLVIAQVRAILKEHKQTKKPQNEAKDHLLRLYRRELPDEFLAWMDSAIVLQNEGQKYPPILGTGGNDGRLDFTQNLMQRLVELGFADGELVAESDEWLKNALFGLPTDGLLKVAIGQYDPGRAGGPNSGQGLSGDSRVNPWEYVLMLEGALLMAGSVTRRLDVNARDKASFPFTVSATAVGNGALSTGEDSRGEIWLPLWRNPARLSELRHIFAEGRAQVGKRQARNALDFARAIAELGIDRGLTSFTRYSFLKRSGKAYLATALGRFETHTPAEDANLLAVLDSWLDRFRRACAGDNVQPRFTSALRRLDEAIFTYCRFGGGARFGEIVRALGQCEPALALNHDKPGIVGRSDYPVPPVPLLSAAWLAAAREDSPEFRLALALAAMRATGDVGALRTNLEVVTPTRRGWDWAKPENRYATVWAGDHLPRNLEAVLERRMMDATRLGLDGLPMESVFPASIEDVSAFLLEQVDDSRLAEWLWGLVLIDLGRARWDNLARTQPITLAHPIPRAYVLLKLLFLPAYHALQTEGGKPIKPEPSILNHLHAGRLTDACQTAVRRLRASGYVPMPGPLSGCGARPVDYVLPRPVQARLAAALLIPVSRPERLQRLVLRPASEPALEAR